MAEPDWDLVIVGGGPAGSAAAAAAVTTHPGLRVLIVDRAAFPRDKTCGDGIAAEAMDLAADLGFSMGPLLAGHPPVSRLRLIAPGGSIADRRLPRPVRVIPRAILDARLLADVRRRGVAFRRHTVRRVEQTGGAVVLDGEIRATVVIGADGAESVLRRACNGPGRTAGPVALAIRGYAPEPPGQAGTQLIAMSARNWPAYAWSFPLGNGLANVGYGELLTGRRLDRTMLRDGLRRLLPGVVDDPTGMRAHRLPLSPGRPPIPDGPVLLAGDAGSLINPLSGEGIFYAFVSGGLAGRAAAAAVAGAVPDAGAAYRQWMGPALRRHLRTTDLLDRLVRRPWLLEAGIRAAADRQRTFDDLVRLSLADGTLGVPLLSGIARHLWSGKGHRHA